MKPERNEINRKLLHLLALLLPTGIFYLPPALDSSKWLAPMLTGILFGAALFLDKLRFSFPAVQKIFLTLFKRLLREKEHRRLTGATHLFGGAFVCAVIFVDSPHISFIALALFIPGDAIASIVGLSIGRIRIMGKTLEGTLSCFGLSLVLFSLLFPRLPLLSHRFENEISFPIIVLTAAAVALLELIPLRVNRRWLLDDNFYVPVLTGIFLQALLSFS